MSSPFATLSTTSSGREVGRRHVITISGSLRVIRPLALALLALGIVGGMGARHATAKGLGRLAGFGRQVADGLAAGGPSSRTGSQSTNRSTRTRQTRTSGGSALRFGGRKSAVSVALGPGGVGVGVATDKTAVAVAVGGSAVGVGVATNDTAVSVGVGNDGVSIGANRQGNRVDRNRRIASPRRTSGSSRTRQVTRNPFGTTTVKRRKPNRSFATSTFAGKSGYWNFAKTRK